MKRTLLSNEQIGTFAMAMSHLLQSGISPGDAMVLLGEDEKDPRLQTLWACLGRDLDEGQSLAAALKRSGQFPNYVCTLMAVGEETGKPQQTLDALASYYRDRARLERQLRSALVYPMVLLAVLLGVVAALLVWVLPVFDEVYAQLGSSLSGISGGLLALGNGIKGLLPWLAGTLAVLAIGWAVPGIRKAGLAFGKKHLGDRGVLRRINTARFVQALWLCTSSGMTVAEATELAASLGETPGFQKRCRICLEEAAAGASLSRALRSAKLLSVSHCRLLEAGERSGRSEQVLRTLAHDLLEAGEEDLVRTVSRVEPVMVTLCSVLIGLVLLSVLLPLLHIMAALG